MTRTLGFCRETFPESCALVLFGATGDLAARKLIPALFSLHCAKMLPAKTYALYVGRTPMAEEAFRAKAGAAVKKAYPAAKAEELASFLARGRYLHADYEDPSFFLGLKAALAAADAERGVAGRRLFYLATPPSAFLGLVARLKEAGLIFDPKDGSCWSRVVIEKPYGTDLAGALELDRSLRRAIAEDQIYRVDHFLGKEAVQNVLAMRAANSIFDETWNAGFLDHVQITIHEELGVEGRAAYFDRTGLARDMLGHALQLASTVGMELPASFKDTDFKKAKSAFFEGLKPLTPEAMAGDLVRAQYSAAGALRGYLDEPGVEPGSATETYFALRFFPGSPRWRGVPFYLRAGKRMRKKSTSVKLVYKKPPLALLAGLPPDYANVFTLEIQPDEKLEMTLNLKHPGPKLCFSGRKMGVAYRRGGAQDIPGDYGRVMLDAMGGDQTLFVSAFEMNFMWDFLSPMLDLWKQEPSACPLLGYKAGGTGPAAARALLQRDGRRWF